MNAILLFNFAPFLLISEKGHIHNLFTYAFSVQKNMLQKTMHFLYHLY